MSNVMELASGVHGQLSFMFTAELFGKMLDGVTDVSGLAVEIVAVDDKVVLANGKSFDRKLPGQATAPGTFTVKMMVPPGGPVEKALWQDIRTGKALQIGPASVTLWDMSGSRMLTWKFGDVFIKELAWSDFGAGDAQLASLTLTLQYNSVKVEK